MNGPIPNGLKMMLEKPQAQQAMQQQAMQQQQPDIFKLAQMSNFGQQPIPEQAQTPAPSAVQPPSFGDRFQGAFGGTLAGRMHKMFGGLLGR